MRRVFKSDWSEIMADPRDWQDRHLEGGTADQRRAALYIQRMRQPYNVRRRLTSTSDYCDWSNHRWLAIRGAMKGGDGDGAFTLTIEYHAESISDDFTPRILLKKDDPNYDTNGRQISDDGTDSEIVVTGLKLTESGAAAYVDLARVAIDSDKLGHVTAVKICASDAGKTYYFSGIALTSGSASSTPHVVSESSGTWGYWSGVPYADDYCIVPVADGRVCMLAESGIGDVYGPRYIEKITGDYFGSPRGQDRAVPMAWFQDQLWAMGEGFTITPVSAAPGALMGWGNAHDYAMYIDTAWHPGGGNCTATWTAQNIGVKNPFFAAFNGTITAKGRLTGLAWDTDTNWPKSGSTVQIRQFNDTDPATDVDGNGGDGTADSHSDTTTTATDANGYFHVDSLEGAGQGALEQQLDAGIDDPGTEEDESAQTQFPRLTNYDVIGISIRDAADDTQPAQGGTFGIVNRGFSAVTISGTPQTVAGDDISMVIPETGWIYRAYVADENITVERRTLWTGGAYTNMGTRAGSAPCLATDTRGNLYLDYVTSGTIYRWNITEDTTMTVATGDKPFVRYNRAGSLRAETRIRDSAVYCDVKDQQGNSISGGEVTVASGVEVSAAPVDFMPSGKIVIQYSTSSGIQEVSSTDNGRTWA
jgi:hypothetical protein